MNRPDARYDACGEDAWPPEFNPDTDPVVQAVVGDTAAYEGRCEHCGRDIGAGHETYCPYWRPR